MAYLLPLLMFFLNAIQMVIDEFMAMPRFTLRISGVGSNHATNCATTTATATL